MSVSNLNDETLLRFYNDIRSMVTLMAGIDPDSVLGASVRKRARELEDELIKRSIIFVPIIWL